MKVVMLFLLFSLFMVALVTCGSEDIQAPLLISVTSPAYANGAEIPVKYTCQGKDTSPAWEWKGAPKGTKAWAIIFDDPDAPMGTWVHWVLYNLPANAAGLPEGASSGTGLPAGTLQGKNSWGREAYGGPCPPAGKAHRYYLKVYALSAGLSLKAGADKSALLRAMKGRVLARGSLLGNYKRR